MWPSAAWIIQGCSVSGWLLLAFGMAKEKRERGREGGRERERGWEAHITDRADSGGSALDWDTHHTHIITRHRRSVEVPLHSHTPLSVYILHTPAAAVQLNLLTGRKTTKAPLTEYMLNTVAPGCVCMCVYVCVCLPSLRAVRGSMRLHFLSRSLFLSTNNLLYMQRELVLYFAR